MRRVRRVSRVRRARRVRRVRRARRVRRVRSVRRVSIGPILTIALPACYSGLLLSVTTLRSVCSSPS